MQPQVRHMRNQGSKNRAASSRFRRGSVTIGHEEVAWAVRLREPSAGPMEEVSRMINDPDHRMHEDEHPHVHSPACGHETRKHGDHDDYEHDGHWHAKDGGHYDEHGDVAG